MDQQKSEKKMSVTRMKHDKDEYRMLAPLHGSREVVTWFMDRQLPLQIFPLMGQTAPSFFCNPSVFVFRSDARSPSVCLYGSHIFRSFQTCGRPFWGQLFQTFYRLLPTIKLLHLIPISSLLHYDTFMLSLTYASAEHD